MTIEVAAKDPERVKIFKTRTNYQIPEPDGEDDPLIEDIVLNLELEPASTSWQSRSAMRLRS